jgi:hypothetical protein
MRMFMLEATLFLYPCISREHLHLNVSQPIVNGWLKGKLDLGRDVIGHSRDLILPLKLNIILGLIALLIHM